MDQLSKRERVEAALKGEAVDRVPVSAWRHFLASEGSPETLAQVTLQHYRDYDWDWVKINPRATYYAEAWGNRYDFSDYDSVIPRLIDGPIHSVADLGKIQPINPTGGVFAEQLELVKRVKAGLGDTPFLQTVFSPITVLSFLAAHPKTHSISAFAEAQYGGVRQLLHDDPAGAHAALGIIADVLGKYAAAAVDSGASGIFFAIVKLAREGVLTEAEFTEFGKPYDLQVLKAVQGAPFNLLHICGPYAYFSAVTDYPVDALNWATVGQHNPTVGEAKFRTDKALMGGVDEVGTLQTGTPDQVIAEALEAIRETNGRHFLLTPGCGTFEDVPSENLHALRRAADLAVESA
ncbi:MAG TPA: uroporphyrinogen decarboxylase family protein [Phototrophicaceae bacterium]|nr:uroporphyrinogen decarboxylase family protein [Phototrophicaceae bacterium]